MKKNDGGPVIPHDGQANYTGGLTLRQFYAGMALQGLLANPNTNYYTAKTAIPGALQAPDALIEAENREEIAPQGHTTTPVERKTAQPPIPHNMESEPLSACCGAPAIPDTDICSKCRDHSGFAAEKE